ncbi:MAG: hypothetical protein JWQ99_2475, partial [Blastococcus sp.]|nr:hypothetical protein [Blastococcus sp.]
MISRNGTAGTRSAAPRDHDDIVEQRLHALAPHLDGEPDPAFRAATRARLVAMAAVRSPEPEPVSPLRRLLSARAGESSVAPWRTRLTAGLAGAALTVTALSTMVALSSDAHPGDVLYGLKRGTEQTQLALAGDSRGRTFLQLASTRLDELEYLVSEDATALAPGAAATGGPQIALAAGADPRLVIETLDTMDTQTTDGAAWLGERAVTTEDAAPLDGLATWAADQSAGLSALASDVPAAARNAFDDSLALLADVSGRATGLEAALDCASGPATDGSDPLGPVPAACAPAPTTPGNGSTAGTGSAPGAGGSTGTTPPSGTSGQPGSVPGSPGAGVPGGELPGGGTPGNDPTGGLPNTDHPLPTPSLPLPSTGIAPP